MQLPSQYMLYPQLTWARRRDHGRPSSRRPLWLERYVNIYHVLNRRDWWNKGNGQMYADLRLQQYINKQVSEL
jgi:hypothetical protein